MTNKELCQVVWRIVIKNFILDITVLNPIRTRCCVLPASSKDYVEFLLCEFILAPN